MTDQELASLKATIDRLAILYPILFGASLVIIVLQTMTPHGFGGPLSLVWAMTLGGAVATRLYRNSLVTKYNASISKGPAPLTPN